MQAPRPVHRPRPVFLRSGSGWSRCGLALALGASLQSCSPVIDTSSSTLTRFAGAALPCPALADATLALRMSVPRVVISRALSEPATQKLPAHCLVDGEINRRIGRDGQSYAIRFRMRMPLASDWNQRFFMAGGGGTNGVVTDPADRMAQGYAVIGTDSGHDNTLNNLPMAGGAAAFGADPQARRDFAYASYDQVTQVGKTLSALHYGKFPKRSYFAGCSEGGREAMLMSQRYPAHYDGVIAGDPVLHLPLGPMAGIRTTQIFAALARRQGQFHTDGEPALGKTFSDAHLQTVRMAVLEACDELDGLRDGSVDHLQACTPARVRPHLESKRCKNANDTACLSPDQITSLVEAFSGVRDSKGRQLYPAWPWDGGIGGMAGNKANQAWRSWWLGGHASPRNDAIKLRYSTPLAVAYSTPPMLPIRVEDSLRYSLDYDFDVDPARLQVSAGEFTESAAQLYFTDATDLSAFRRRGGKIMLYHGASDSAVSMWDTLAWYQAMSERTGTGTADFARLFLVPGMGHCRGGPATDQFDMLPALVDWVENNKAPASIQASASLPDYFDVSARTRPLCPFPAHARYKGSGDINDAVNFFCKTPETTP